ncbi:MAG: tripartite tricarboxylate transporter substrate binding protein [Burkholderiaceae bacterium]|nr:tripartite tricarboxylate transporter substrate binding protein [Burkholderiaceae bacterium]
MIHSTFKRIATTVALGVVTVSTTLFAQAQTATTYPDRPVKILVGFTAGGTTDVIARAIANELPSRMKGANFIVENKPGAGGNIATADVIKATPDGYSILMASVGPLTINPSLQKLAYDPLKDLVPIILVADVPNVLVVNPEKGIKNFKEFETYVKANSGKLNYASTGVGTSAHLSSFMLMQRMGIEAVHIPYKGAEALNDLLAGRTEFMFATIPSVITQIKSGKLIAIAVSSLERSRSMPNVPTIAESGFPGYASGSWFGLLAPKGTPKDIIEKLNKEVNAIMPNLEQRFIAAGADPVGKTPAFFGEFMAKETAKWKKVVEDSNAAKK